jgi:hypothetical protein
VGARPDALKAVIEEAWQVFDQPAPRTTGVCVGCCMDPKIEADFLKRKARELPSAYVREWYFAAYANDISHDHIAWLLPRVMEMLADEEEVASVGHEVIFARLPLTGFPDRWPHAEVAVVNRFARALFERKLGEADLRFPQDIDSWLCMFGQGGIDIDPLLRQMDVLSDDDLAALLHRNWFYHGHGSIRFDAFWSLEPAKSMAWRWYTSPTLAARMERAAMAGNEKALDIYDLIVTCTHSPSRS